MQGNKRVYWLAQFVGWFAYGALIFLATYNDEPERVNWKLIVELSGLLLSCIGITHLTKLIYIHKGWLQIKFTPLLPKVLASSLVGAIVISLISTAVSYWLEPTKTKSVFSLDFTINVVAIWILVLFWNSIYFTFHFFQKSRKQELDNLILESSRNEIELKNLRSQLNPHFLFNSLNSIRALIDLEPNKAKEAVTTLSNLLRKSLRLGRENYILLDEELSLVSSYLELEKIRFEERLTVKWCIDDTLRQVQIPPFCIQTLVENAIKHGISERIDGGEILVEAVEFNQYIKLSVMNSGNLKSTSSDSGIGIENIKRRLQLQYKDAAAFNLYEKEEKVFAELLLER